MSIGQSVAMGGKEANKPNGVHQANGDSAIDLPALTDESNIHERVLYAAALCPKLDKDGKVVSKDNKPLYEYVSHDNIVEHGKKALIKCGVLWKHEIDRASFARRGNTIEFWVITKLINVKNPDDFLVYECLGEGTDNSDKGSSKAYTNAVKQNFSKALALNTFEDKEQTFVERTDPERMSAAADVAATAVASWQSNILEEIGKANSVDDLKRIRRDQIYFLKPVENGGAKDIPEGVKQRVLDAMTEKKLELGEAANAGH